MRAEVGATLVLAGSVLIGAGLIADAIWSSQGSVGYILGAIVGVVGIVALIAGPLKRAWDAIPVDRKRPPPPP
jgi:uncharacterized membrane protein YeaQ/YmgE (transglycosylase-associated protein family)